MKTTRDISMRISHNLIMILVIPIGLCSVLAIKGSGGDIDNRDSDGAVTGTPIGSSGGTVKPAEGAALSPGTKLVVPPNAASHEVPILLTVREALDRTLAEEADGSVITALMAFAMNGNKEDALHPVFTPAAILAGGTSVGLEFELYPDGTQFLQPVILEIPLADITLQPGDMVVVLVVNADGIVEVVQDVQMTANHLRVPLQHFTEVTLWKIIGNAAAFAVLSPIMFPENEIRHARQLVGPFVAEVSRDMLAAQCTQSGKGPFINSGMLPSYSQLLNNLARSDGDIGGETYEQQGKLRVWLENIRLQGLPSVSMAEIHKKALELAGGDVFQALVVAHEVLRSDRDAKKFIDLIQDVRGDSTDDEVGARYHLLGTAIYGFWYEHMRFQPGGVTFVVPAWLSAFFEESFVSGDIFSDPGEFVVDLAGSDLGRDLYRNTVAAQAGTNKSCGGEGTLPEFPITYSGTGTTSETWAHKTYGSATCPTMATWWISLYSNGTLQGEYEALNPQVPSTYGSSVTRCVDSSNDWSISFGGKHYPDGSFEINPSGSNLYYDYTNHIFLTGKLTGTFNANNIKANYYYNDPTSAGGELTLEHEFDLPKSP